MNKYNILLIWIREKYILFILFRIIANLNLRFWQSWDSIWKSNIFSIVDAKNRVHYLIIFEILNLNV